MYALAPKIYYVVSCQLFRLLVEVFYFFNVKNKRTKENKTKEIRARKHNYYRVVTHINNRKDTMTTTRKFQLKERLLFPLTL